MRFGGFRPFIRHFINIKHLLNRVHLSTRNSNITKYTKILRMIDFNLPNKVLWKVSEFAWFHSLHLNTSYCALEYLS